MQEVRWWKKQLPIYMTYSFRGQLSKKDGRMILIWLKDFTACLVLDLLSALLKTQQKEAEL